MTVTIAALALSMGVCGTATRYIESAHQPEGVWLAGSMELARLADLVAAQLKITIEYEPGSLTTFAVIRREAPLSDTELWELFNRQLAAKAMTTVIAPGSLAYTVVSVQSAATIARVEKVNTPAEPATGDRAEFPAGFQRVLYRAMAAKPETLAEALRPMLSKPGGTLEVLSGTDMIMLSDLTSRLAELRAVLVTLDESDERVTLERVHLRHLFGTQASALAMQFALKRETAGAPRLRGEIVAASDPKAVVIVAPRSSMDAWRELLMLVDQLEPVRARTYSMESHAARDVAALIESTLRGETASDTRFRVVADPLTESLIITGTEAQHTQIEAIVERLASVPASERRQLRTIPVKHRPAADVLAIVDTLMAAGAAGVERDPQSGSLSGPEPRSGGSDDRSGISRLSGPGGSPEQRSGVTTGGAPAHAGAPGRSARQGAPPDLTLTLDAGAGAILAIGPPRLLDQVETLVASLDVRQRQVELQLLLVSLTESQTKALGAEIRGEVGLGEIDLKLASLFGLSSAAGDAVPGIGSPAGLSGLVLSPGEFSVLVRALETINQGRSLSMPRVIVATSQQASIDAVLQQPFSSLNAGDTVSTTSFGGTQDAGTQVTLTPQVSSGDHVILDYTISLSAFVGESSAEGLPPPRQQNRLQSIVTIPDGSTIAIGGIELNTETQATSQVPFFGDLPLVGELLKNRSRSQGRQRFYAFIRPTILRSDDFSDLKYLSSLSVSEAGIAGDEPPLAPRVIR